MYIRLCSNALKLQGGYRHIEFYVCNEMLDLEIQNIKPTLHKYIFIGNAVIGSLYARCFHFNLKEQIYNNQPTIKLLKLADVKSSAELQCILL